MIETDLAELIGKVRTMKAESQTIELKAAHQGCPKKLYATEGFLYPGRRF